MSLPSLARLAPARTVNKMSPDQLEEILLQAMREDLSLACDYLHKLSHGDGSIATERPKSALGQQLIRICASDAMRPIAEKRLCHGKRITFYNCCSVQVTDKKPALEQLMTGQIKTQNGVLASADC
jgi:hypothetical protein